MSSEISQNIINITKDGVLKIVISLGTQDWLTELSGFKKKINKKTGRDNYCKTVLLLWGFMQYELDQVNDDMFNRSLQFSVHVLNNALKRKELKPFFYGVDLNPNKDGSYSKLNYEICSWFHKNDSLPGVQIITITGKHLYALLSLKDRLKSKHIKALYKAGSLIEENTNGMGVMKSILMDNKIKFNF